MPDPHNWFFAEIYRTFFFLIFWLAIIYPIKALVWKLLRPGRLKTTLFRRIN